jgi:integrase
MPALEKTRTPGIYRRGGRYVVVWRHRGIQHKSFHRTYEEAREAKGLRQAGGGRPYSRVTFSDYFEEWIRTYTGRTARGLNERSRELYRRAVSELALGHWENWRLVEIEPTDVRRLYLSLRGLGASTSALRQLRSALSALFATALEDGLVGANPIGGVRIPPGQDWGGTAAKPKALTHSELGNLMAELPAKWRLFFEFLTHTGLRISEALALRWEHLDLGKRPLVRVREQLYNGEASKLKSEHARRDVPLAPGMVARLRDLRPQRDGWGWPVFPSSAGTPLNRPNIAARVLKPAAKRAGLTVDRDGEEVAWVSFHTFRHTCASLLFEEGRNVKQVAEWLGHSDPSFTLRTYVHLLDAGVGEADFLDAAVSPPCIAEE